YLYVRRLARPTPTRSLPGSPASTAFCARAPHTRGVLRLLAVGLGQSGRHWVAGMLPQVPEVELAGCVDVDPAALHLVVEHAGVPEERCFTLLGDALAATDADAVLVATNLPGHVPVARN